MDYELGKTVLASGCVTRLIDVVNRSPGDLEEGPDGAIGIAFIARKNRPMIGRSKNGA